MTTSALLVMDVQNGIVEHLVTITEFSPDSITETPHL